MLRSWLLLAVSGLALQLPSAVGFREMSTVLESFLQNGGWVVAAGQPFALQSIFRYQFDHIPDLQPGMVGMPAPTPQCVDDSNGEGPVQLKACRSAVENQLFVFNQTSYSLQSASKPLSCLTVTDDASSSLELTPCDFYNPKQKFMYNYFTYQWLLAEPSSSERDREQKPMCIDDGGADSGASSTLGLADCKSFGSPAQTLMAVSDVTELPALPTDGTPKIFAIGFPFRLRLFSSFLCVADDGEANSLTVEPCVFNPSEPQTFAYDTTTSQIKSVAKAWLCLSAGAAIGDDEASLELQQCAEGDPSQIFKFDEASGVLTTPSKPGFCVDTNGPRYPEKTPMSLRVCKQHSWNQIFTVEGVSPLPPPVITVRD